MAISKASSKKSSPLRPTTFDPALKLSRLNGTNGFRLDGVNKFDESGSSVSSAGDVNGDGFDDLIIGAYLADPNDISAAGSSYVVFGKASGYRASLRLGKLDGSNGFRLDGVQADDSSGDSVSSAGDVNGDGFDDLIIGAPYGDLDGQNRSGSSYVVFGKASDFRANLNLSKLNGSNGFRLDAFGIVASVSSAGDVNGDGFDDLIIGVPYGDLDGQNRAGYSCVVFGKASGYRANLNLSKLDGTNGFHLDGVNKFDKSGISVSSAGDVNGDGLDDLIIGAPYGGSNDQFRAGSSYVVFGKASGYRANLNLSKLNGKNGFRLDGAQKLGFSGDSVSSAGDVNGDGFADVIIGAPYTTRNGQSSSGSSYTVFGKATGFRANLNLSKLNGKNGFRLDGETSYGYVGGPVSDAGDFNGDGFDDLIISESGRDSSYLMFGKASGFRANLNLSKLDGKNGFRLDSDFPGLFEHIVSGAGDINGDGFDDLIIGAPDLSPSGKSDAGSSFVVFGRATTRGGSI